MNTLSIVHAVRSDGFAGVERHMAALATAQAAQGHRVAIVGGESERMCAAVAGTCVAVLPAKTILDVASALRRFRGLDILHVHMTAAEAASLVTPGLGRVPVVATRHFGRTRGSSIPGRVVSVAIRRRVVAQIAISDYVAGLVDGPSTVVHPGVPNADLVPAMWRTRTVLVAQRLEVEKDTDRALHAFASSGLAQAGWRLQVAGDGSERPALEDLARGLGLSGSIDFLGMRRDVETLMASAGVLLAPCEIEGLGMTVLEAMASGLPVVAPAAAGHLETVGAVNPHALYAPGDAAGAGDIVAHLAEDSALRDSYGAALQTAQRSTFTLPAQAEATDAVYRSVL